MIFDICAIFGHNVRPGDHSRMCFEPIASYTMSFRSFRTSFRPFSTFSMFLYYFRGFLAYIWLIATLKDYLCIPHTIVYLYDVFPTLSDLLQSLFIFALINVPMFWLFWWLIGFTDCDVTICSDSNPYWLLVISKPPDAISTPPMFLLLILYPPLPCKNRITSYFVPPPL